MKEDNNSEVRRATFLRKMAEVADFVESSNIRNIDRRVIHVDEIFLNRNPFFSPLDLMCDMQNIPKWWRMVFNWGSDIVRSLSWAMAWAKLLDGKRIQFQEAEGNRGQIYTVDKSTR